MSRLLVSQTIEKDDEEIYRYGVWRLLVQIFEYLNILLIGAIFDQIFYTIVFTLAFGCIRQYAGGYHASTHMRCYGLTMIMIAGVMIIMKWINPNMYLCICLIVISAVCIYILSPVEADNKPLDEIERMLYRKKSIMFNLVDIFVASVLIAFGMYKLSFCIGIAMIMVSISLMIGYLHQRRTEVKDK